MIKNIVYKLPFEVVFDYFVSNIKCGKYLSEIICEKINFRKGSFFTILPEKINIEQLFQFPYGGVLLRDESNIHQKCIFTMDSECSNYIHTYLKEDKKHVAIIENYMLDINSLFTRIENVQMVPFNSEVYYFLYGNNSKEEIYRTIRKSSLVWHFTAVLTEVSSREFKSLTESNFVEFYTFAKVIICSAYDGEGYIFWKKNNS